MGKNNIQISFISTGAAVVLFGISILFTGLNYFYSAKQIQFLLPGFIPGKHIWVYITGTALTLAGIAIIINKRITTIACFLLAFLLTGLAIVIDLRGLLNSEDEIKYIFSEALIKDFALIAGALIIANFEREKPRRHGKRRHKKSSSNTEKQATIPLA